MKINAIKEAIKNIKIFIYSLLGIGGIEAVNHWEMPNTPPPVDIPFLQEIIKVISQIIILIATLIMMFKKKKEKK